MAGNGVRQVCNSQVEDFIREKRMQALRANVKKARTVVNTGWSRREEERLATSRRNVKREQIQDDRLADIKRENMRLLLRMQTIGEDAQHGGTHLPQLAPTRCQSMPEVRKGSNAGARMKEMRRIDNDNRRLLKRLQTAKPSVSMAKIEEEARHKERVMLMRCEFQGLPGEAPLMPRRQIQSRYREEHGRPMRLPPLQGNAESTPVPMDGMANGANGEEAGRSQAARPGDLDVGESGAAEDDVPTGDADEGHSPSGLSDLDPCERYGLVMPSKSRALAESLLEAQEEQRAAEEEAEAAKEAARRALQAAEAVDADDAGDMLSYENVVKRCDDALQQRLAARSSKAASAASTAAMAARQAVAASMGR